VYHKKGVIFRMTIGSKIRQIRLERGIKQKDLAASAGIPTITLQQYERGVTKQPKIDQVKKIAIALDVPVSVLLNTAEIENRVQEETLELIAENLGTTPSALKGEIESAKRKKSRKILSQEEVNRQIAEAEQEHTAYLEKLCFDPRMPDEDYPARIRYVTSFIENNSDTLKLAMPGTSMLPDDIEEAKKIRAAGGTPDSSK
jgi:DNA-binding helix-turn-helix protein